MININPISLMIYDQGRTKFLLVLIGGVLIEMGHPFVMIVATKVIAIKTCTICRTVLDLTEVTISFIINLIQKSQTKWDNHNQILIIINSS